MSLFIKRLRSRTRKLFGIGKRPKTHRNLKARFTYVYRGKAWESSQSASGPGSDLGSGSVNQACNTLSKIIDDYDIRSIADLPCGDFNWIYLVLEKHPSVAYAGYDIVPALVSANRKAHPNRNFVKIDITRQIPAKSDLLFSKDLVNHLMERDVWSAIANMVRSGATYLMISSNAGFETNVELPENVGGMSRPLNLQISPYDFPPPLYDDGYLAMWRTEDLNFVLDRTA